MRLDGVAVVKSVAVSLCQYEAVQTRNYMVGEALKKLQHLAFPGPILMV